MMVLGIHPLGAVDRTELTMILMALRLLGLGHLGILERVPLHRVALWWLACQSVEETKNSMVSNFRAQAQEEKKGLKKQIMVISQ